MRDRTKELGNNPDASEDDDEGQALMIKPGTSSAKEEKENEAFLKKMQEIHEGLNNLKGIVSELENKQKKVLGVPLPEESMKKELQTLRDEFKTLATQIQKKLKSIEPKKGEDDGKYISINVRMQRTQHGVLTKELVELMGRCNTIQSQYRDRNVERIQRQLKITGNNTTDEELDRMLESGETDVFTQNVSSRHFSNASRLFEGLDVEKKKKTTTQNAPAAAQLPHLVVALLDINNMCKLMTDLLCGLFPYSQTGHQIW
ncbi:syntaxin-4 isoform X2 [Labrus bergylta]|uniref:syntaxin-4 isoform X2 n=1 Tax=Labrus bergylta TaxID=56723 RepID=UPI0033144200